MDVKVKQFSSSRSEVNYKGNKFKKIGVSLLSENPNSLQLLGLLNCDTKVFSTLKSKYKYLIIPETSTREYSEMFLKGFSIAKQNTADLDFCIKIGILGIMLRTNKEIAYTIYKDGKSFNWDS